MSRYYGIGTSEELFGRLYMESLNFGNMLELLFGRIDSQQYSKLFSQFTISLRDLISAQLAGDMDAAQRHVAELYKNDADRGAFMESINPFWNDSEYRRLSEFFIQYILEDANALASGDFKRDIELYDIIIDITNQMGYGFAQGIYDYMTSGAQNASNIPEHGDIRCITFEEMNEIYDIRMFWFELAIWVRNYMISRYRGLGDTTEVLTRLEKVIVDYTDSLEQVFGRDVADKLLGALMEYIDLLSAFITAQMNDDTAEMDRITKLLYQNADERAALISSVNPFWDYDVWKNRLQNNLRITIEESISFLTGDYARNIDIFSTLLDLAEDTSNYFATGLFNYIDYYQ
jgi:hypothetical protein